MLCHISNLFAWFLGNAVSYVTTATATRTAKKYWVYISKTTILHVHHAFLYIY